MSNENYLNDPKLTAYLLGELEPTEHVQIEAWLKTSPEGRAQLAELQATTETLFAALQQESTATNPKQPIATAVHQALALPKDANSTQRANVSALTSKPLVSNHAGSTLLATVGTVAALLITGLVCLQSGDSDQVAANRPAPMSSRLDPVLALDETKSDRFGVDYVIPSPVEPNQTVNFKKKSEDEFLSKPETSNLATSVKPQTVPHYDSTQSDSSPQMLHRGTITTTPQSGNDATLSVKQLPATLFSSDVKQNVPTVPVTPAQNSAGQPFYNQPNAPQHVNPAYSQYDNSSETNGSRTYDASGVPDSGGYAPLQKSQPGAGGAQQNSTTPSSIGGSSTNQNEYIVADSIQPAFGIPAEEARTLPGLKSTPLQGDDGRGRLSFQSGLDPQNSRGVDQRQKELPTDAELKKRESLFGRTEGLSEMQTDFESHLVQNATESKNGRTDDVLELGVQPQPAVAGKAVDGLTTKLSTTLQIVVPEMQEQLLSERQAPVAASIEKSEQTNDRIPAIASREYPHYAPNDPRLFFDGEQEIVRYDVAPETLHRFRMLKLERAKLAQQEAYAPIVENEFLSPKDAPYSTFSIDVDTGSYANVRRFLHNNHLPPTNAVRLEELINSFEYTMTQPTDEHPVAITLESGDCPWNATHQLVRIGVKAKEIDATNRPATSLVFLIDVSGSMKDANKLPLAQAALRLLVEQMEENDRIAIVTYASDAKVALESTDGSQKDVILEKIDSLGAGGSTNGEGGIHLAYKIAKENLIEEGTNRILVCTDGDFNVGTSSDDGVFQLIEEHRKSGVFLSVLGFGTGNLKDSKLEGIANRGNGHYSYIDRLEEAQNVLVKHLTGTLYTVAKDVKLQVEFNPTQVESYRLLGYENRALAAKDFNNDQVDAGEMGAGHTVTALYEITIIGTKVKQPAGVDAPRYQKKTEIEVNEEKVDVAEKDVAEKVVHGEELLFVKLRYKQPQSDESVKLEIPLMTAEDPTPASNDLAWSSTVASFGMLLRDSKFKGDATWDSLLSQTRDAMKDHSSPERIEFVDLVLRARGLWRRANGHESETPVKLLSLDAREKASCNERYKDLLDKFERPEDLAAYGDFYDFGHRHGKQFLGKEGVPDGYWVYVYPNWYVWGSTNGDMEK